MRLPLLLLAALPAPLFASDPPAPRADPFPLAVNNPWTHRVPPVPGPGRALRGRDGRGGRKVRGERGRAAPPDRHPLRGRGRDGPAVRRRGEADDGAGAGEVRQGGVIARPFSEPTAPVPGSNRVDTTP